jgi:peptide/nickel transport system substrate-binding protein
MMQERGNLCSYIFVILLYTLILLKFLSIFESERIYVGLNRLIDGFEHGERWQRASNVDVPEEERMNEGDWLVWAFGVEPKTLNPYSSDVYSQWITFGYIFEPLLFYDFNDLQMLPHLAEGYEVSRDGLEITFHLRDDVYFSDGVQVTSDDVIFSFETAKNPAIGASIGNAFSDVERAVKVDDKVLKFELKRTYFKSLEGLSFWGFGILPKHVYEFEDVREFQQRLREPVGSGPFLFEKWSHGDSIVLRRNEHYWGERAKLERIVYRFISHSASAAQALRCGEVDIMIPKCEQYTAFSRDEDFRKQFRCLDYWSPGAPFYFIGWNEKSVFFSDKRVRLAMTYLIDRKQIISKLLDGYGAQISGPFFVQGRSCDKEIEPWPFDPVQAIELLERAGWIDRDGDGVRERGGQAFRFHLLYSGQELLYTRIARLFQDWARREGVDVVLEPMEWTSAYSRIQAGDFEAMLMGWSSEVLEDYYPLFHSSQIGQAGSNYVGFSNEDADLLLEKIRCSLDAGRRESVCRRLHRVLHEEQPYTFLFSRPSFRLIDRRFKNVRVYRLGLKYWDWYVPFEEQRYR